MGKEVVVEVKNVPDYAEKHPFWVVRFDDNTRALWFYGAWDDKTKAEQCVEETMNGLLVLNRKGETV